VKLNEIKLTPEQQERVDRARKRHEATKVEPEWALLAKAGVYFGWGAIVDSLNNMITLEQLTALVNGADKKHASDVIDMANAVYIGSGAAQSKKGDSIMKQGLKEYMKVAKS